MPLQPRPDRGAPSQPGRSKNLPSAAGATETRKGTGGAGRTREAGRFQTTAPRVNKLSSPAPTGTPSARDTRKTASRPLPAASSARWGRAGWIALLLGLLVIGSVVALSSNAFTVSAAQITVAGNQRVATDEILRVSRVEGANVLLLQSQAVAARVRGIEGIATAVVHRRLAPPAQVVIEVKEEVPLVAWHVITETQWLSASGANVPMTGDPPPLTLTDATGAARNPVVAASSGQDGPVAPGGDGMRAKILEDLKALQEARPDLTNLYYGPSEGLYFRVPEGYTVYLGDDGPVASKLALLAATQAEFASQSRHLETIDLRSPGRALVK